ncbi:MAG: TMEM165/GDT1 family protein, partial [Wenzhouxiangellaceae bacterium]|nr:TMEM165/GDT1 family protein [Wenzhouxiangellaceae bacterium]
MEAFLAAAAAVGLAELGDKTQLLVLLLVRRFRRPVAVGVGMVAALLASNLLASLAGVLVEGQLPPFLGDLVVGLLFVTLGAWILREDDDPAERLPDRPGGAWRAGLVAASVFLVAEFADKSQLATVGMSMTLSAWIPVAVGATAGAALVNLPVLWIGHRLRLDRWKTAIRVGSALVFLAIGA